MSFVVISFANYLYIYIYIIILEVLEDFSVIISLFFYFFLNDRHNIYIYIGIIIKIQKIILKTEGNNHFSFTLSKKYHMFTRLIMLYKSSCCCEIAS